MAKSKKKPKKPKKPKPRIKVAPPSKRHKSVKDYDRKSLGKELKETLENVIEQERADLKPVEFMDHQVHAGSSLASFLNEKVTTNPWDNISLRDFLRVQGEQQVKLVEGDLIFETEQCGCTQEKGCLDPIEFKNHQVHNGTELTNKSIQIRNETPKTWVDSFFAIFGFKRK